MTTVTAKGFVQLQTNFTDAVTGTIVADNSATQNVLNMTYGAAGLLIDAAVTNTGILASGQTLTINLQSLTKTFLGYTSTVVLSGIKGFCVANLATASGQDINVRATGTNAFTNLFNGGSGNLLIKPYSAFIYTDPYKTPVATGQKNVQLVNVSNTGIPYSYTVAGNLT